MNARMSMTDEKRADKIEEMNYYQLVANGK
jgi:hypothetical protein